MPFSGESNEAASPLRAQIRHPRLVRLYDHWEAKRGGRLMPSRADMDPVELPFVLGHLLLMDVIGPKPWRFRYRLVGSHLTHRAGRDLTGRFVDELSEADYRDSVLAWHGWVVENRVPRWGTTKRVIGSKWLEYELLTLPLAKKGGDVDMTLTGLYYADEPR